VLITLMKFDTYARDGTVPDSVLDLGTLCPVLTFFCIPYICKVLLSTRGFAVFCVDVWWFLYFSVNCVFMCFFSTLILLVGFFGL